MKSKFLLHSVNLLFILASFILHSSCKKEQPDGEEELSLEYTREEIAYKSIEGIPSNLLSLDVFYDPSQMQPKPVVIWVHGGGWCIGDKRTHMQYKKDLFSKLGYILVSINYRLSPFPYETDNPDRIKFPLHNIDVADAVKWVYDHIEEYGGDPNRLLLLGHSAGAHLVALTGTNLSFLEQAGVPVSAIKGVDVIDTTAYDLYNIIQSGNASAMLINAFGTDPQENIEASPQRNLNNGTSYPSFFIAKRGDTYRLGVTNAFIQSLRDHSVEVTDVEVQEYTHSGINAAIGKPGESLITPPLTEFMDTCFQED